MRTILLFITITLLTACATNPYGDPFNLGDPQYPRYDRAQLEQYQYGGYHYYRGWQP